MFADLGMTPSFSPAARAQRKTSPAAAIPAGMQSTRPTSSSLLLSLAADDDDDDEENGAGLAQWGADDDDDLDLSD